MAAASPDLPGARMTGARPGWFVMVVGPSGVGKDSLIRVAREILAGDERYVFPRRLVTRPPSATEDNVEIAPSVFEDLKGAGRLAVGWSAHGLSYGLPVEIDREIEAGKIVVCNVSRSVVGDLRARYVKTRLVEVTAPPEVLAARLAARKRGEDGNLGLRLSRPAPSRAELRPDVVVDNRSTLDEAAAAFLAALDCLREGSGRLSDHRR